MSLSLFEKRLLRLASLFSGREDLGIYGPADLADLARNELGSLEIFDGALSPGAGRLKAVAPGTIYHVLASNLSVSAETSLLLGLMLGSKLIFKLPGVGLPGFEATVEKLPADLKARVAVTRNFDESEMKKCDAVVVYGSNDTVDFFREKIGRGQRALFYGHRISFGVLEEGVGDLSSWAEKAAEEVIAYEQQGCLSPQFYLATREDEASAFAELLAAALEKRNVPGVEGALSFEDLAQRRHARRMLRGRGEKIWESDEGNGFTVALMSRADFWVGPGHRFVQVGFATDPAVVLSGWKGQISSIAVAAASWPAISKQWEELAEQLGASRLCRMGNLQKPPLSWRHDGRPRLGDLVTWISMDD